MRCSESGARTGAWTPHLLRELITTTSSGHNPLTADELRNDHQSCSYVIAADILSADTSRRISSPRPIVPVPFSRAGMLNDALS